MGSKSRTAGRAAPPVGLLPPVDALPHALGSLFVVQGVMPPSAPAQQELDDDGANRDQQGVSLF